MDIMSFNITTSAEDARLQAREEDDALPWQKRAERVISMIRFKNPMIVGLQEATLSQLQDVMDGVRPRYTGMGCCATDLSNAEQVPILYNNHRVTCLNKGNFWLSETPDVPATKSFNSSAPHMVTWGKFKHNGCDNHRHHVFEVPKDLPFFVFNTQLDEKCEETRACETAVLMTKIDEIMAADDGQTPLAFLLVDLNCPRGSLPWQIITGKAEFCGSRGWFVDSWGIATNRANEIHRTFHDYKGDDDFDPDGSQHQDFVFHGVFPGAINVPVELALEKIKVKRAAVLSCFESIGDVPPASDHYPVLAKFELY